MENEKDSGVVRLNVGGTHFDADKLRKMRKKARKNLEKTCQDVLDYAFESRDTDNLASSGHTEIYIYATRASWRSHSKHHFPTAYAIFGQEDARVLFEETCVSKSLKCKWACVKRVESNEALYAHHVFLNTGHAAQDFPLTSVWKATVSWGVGAYDDEKEEKKEAKRPAKRAKKTK